MRHCVPLISALQVMGWVLFHIVTETARTPGRSAAASRMVAARIAQQIVTRHRRSARLLRKNLSPSVVRAGWTVERPAPPGRCAPVRPEERSRYQNGARAVADRQIGSHLRIERRGLIPENKITPIITLQIIARTFQTLYKTHVHALSSRADDYSESSALPYRVDNRLQTAQSTCPVLSWNTR